MLRYKIAGAINLLLGFFQSLTSLSFLFFTLPNMREFYFEFKVETPNFAMSYLVLGLVLLMGLINLFLGFKLILKTKEVTEKYFHYSVTLIVVSLILSGLYLSFLVGSAVFPLYNLSNSL